MVYIVLRWMSALWYGSYTFRLDLVTCCVVLVLCFLYAVPCGGSSIELATSGSGPVGPGSEGRHILNNISTYKNFSVTFCLSTILQYIGKGRHHSYIYSAHSIQVH